jgi:molecular chaperone HtpG
VFGPAAPRTNVARTALENTPESENLSACAYQTFKQAVLFEVERKRSEEGLSLTRATNEVSFIAYPLISIKSARNLEALRAVVNSIPVCMIEGRRDHNGRAPCTVRELQSLGEFWTVESETVRAAESLLGQFSSDTGIHDAVESLSGNRVSLPKPLLCNLSSLGHYFQQAFFSAFQVISIHSHENEQRVDFLWSQPTYDSWIDVVKVMEDTERTADSRARNALRTALRQRYPVEFPGGGPPLWFGLDGMKITGFLGCGGVRAYHRILLFPNEPVTPFMAGLLSANPSSTEAYAYSVILYRILRVPRTADAQAASRGIQQLEMEVPGLKLESKAEFLDALERSTLRIYDPLVWQQRAFSLDREDW